MQAAGGPPPPIPELLSVPEGCRVHPVLPFLPTLKSSAQPRACCSEACSLNRPLFAQRSPNNHQQWQGRQGWPLEGEGDAEALAQVPLPDSSRDATQYQLRPDGQTGVMLG